MVAATNKVYNQWRGSVQICSLVTAAGGLGFILGDGALDFRSVLYFGIDPLFI